MTIVTVYCLINAESRPPAMLKKGGAGAARTKQKNLKRKNFRELVSIFRSGFEAFVVQQSMFLNAAGL